MLHPIVVLLLFHSHDWLGEILSEGRFLFSSFFLFQFFINDSKRTSKYLRIRNTSPERKSTLCESFKTYIWHLFSRAGCNCRNPFTSTFLGACARLHWAKRHKTPLKIERAKVFFIIENLIMFLSMYLIMIKYTLPFRHYEQNKDCRHWHKLHRVQLHFCTDIYWFISRKTTIMILKIWIPTSYILIYYYICTI